MRPLPLRFDEAWSALCELVPNSSRGPLDEASESAGRGVFQHLQRQITHQIDRAVRDDLHREMLQLPRSDTRRIAWMSVDRLSSQWVRSYPTASCELSDQEFPEVFCTYLGRESPVVRALAGWAIPCGRTERGTGRPIPCACDEYGFRLANAKLPGDDDTRCHDSIGRELFDIIQEARLRTSLQPSDLFTSIIPVGYLVRAGRPRDIIPDAAIDVALPAVVTARGQRRGAARHPRRLLFDVKTIHVGCYHYYSAHAAEEQSGAVRHREAEVWPDYVSHAQECDRHYYPAAGTTPFEDRLRGHSETRGLVFGGYGEGSADVHDLLSVAADEIAAREWRQAGARTLGEYRSCVIDRLRRRMGLASVRAMARHRLGRVPFIGVPRATVAAAIQRARDQRHAARVGRPPPLPLVYADHFYAWQAGGAAAGPVGA